MRIEPEKEMTTKTEGKWLFVRRNNKTEAPKDGFITGIYDDLPYAKSGADYCKRKYKEDCIILDLDFNIVYDTRLGACG
jgi:hypothetical protein